ncbi:MAG: hypothetical protein FIB01_13470 [Gemmatimonadetes bacterium]|nr:hypothetical protein [Gemmatimonadota bacterium]
MNRHRLGALLAGGLLACGHGNPAEVMPEPAACATGAPVPGTPVNDPSGPYYHQVVVARTADGITIHDPKQVLEHASVPDAVRLADGRVLVYYVNGARGAVWVAELTADTARVPQPIVVGDVIEPGGIVDPDAFLLPDGSVRLYYLNGFGPPGSGAERAICAADSRDGVHFAAGRVALPMQSTELLTDPSVVRLGDGSWRMASSLGQRSILARSADGLSFTRTGSFENGGVPELGLAPAGRLRIYVCAQGIVSWLSGDGGQSWSREATVVPPNTLGKRILCDPSLPPGAGLFVFKTG